MHGPGIQNLIENHAPMLMKVDISPLFCMHTKVLIDIRFNSSIYTVSEDDSFVDLTIIKNISDAETTTENITVHFSTSDRTAKGTCMYVRLVNGCM